MWRGGTARSRENEPPEWAKSGSAQTAQLGACPAQTTQRPIFPATSPRPLVPAADPSLFPKLTEQPLQLLEPLGEVRHVELDQVLFRDGDRADDPMVVLEGRVVVLLGTSEEARQVGVAACAPELVRDDVVS